MIKDNIQRLTWHAQYVFTNTYMHNIHSILGENRSVILISMNTDWPRVVAQQIKAHNGKD